MDVRDAGFGYSPPSSAPYRRSSSAYDYAKWAMSPEGISYYKSHKDALALDDVYNLFGYSYDHGYDPVHKYLSSNASKDPLYAPTPRSSTSALGSSPVNNSTYSRSAEIVNNVLGFVGKFVEGLSARSQGSIPQNSTSAGDPNNTIKDEERDYYFHAFTDYLEAMQRSWKAANEEQRANWERAARWNEQMYDTRYQRTVADLKKAGVNPLLIGGALSSQGSVSMSAAAGFSPSMPSTPYTSTSSSEISGMFNLYSTLINMTSNERVAFLQDKTKNKEIDKAYANNFVATLGRLLGSGITAFAMA